MVYDAPPPTVATSDAHDDDSASIVSGLSMDEDSILVERRLLASMHVLSPIAETTKNSSLPPVEVSIPTPKTIRKTTRPRPHTTSRVSSASSTSKLDQLVANLALSNSGSWGNPTSTHSSPVRRPPMVSRARSAPVMIHIRHSADSVTNGTVLSTESPCPDEKLLQGRKRRHIRTGSQGTNISIGSIVGQSIAPTLSTTDCSDQSTARRSLQSVQAAEGLLRNHTGADDGIACCAVPPKRNVVKQEFKHIMSVVSTPIRKVPFLKRKPADLKRSQGTLT
uniref:Uncharacterized protein n=1 Tax=Grammatophora oceanica TaxID=210454 RepID=A0A7S1Y3R6_9STRA|mmetsp:Transcript_16636/g.24670  ORF Transcript_16636/g.24670 Transcript_16636/m.24670 type:complete len:279 (+) Transcript_16636:1020-1856(+)